MGVKFSIRLTRQRICWPIPHWSAYKTVPDNTTNWSA